MGHMTRHLLRPSHPFTRIGIFRRPFHKGAAEGRDVGPGEVTLGVEFCGHGFGPAGASNFDRTCSYAASPASVIEIVVVPKLPVFKVA